MVIDPLEFARFGIKGARILNGHRQTLDFSRLCNGLPSQKNNSIDWEISGYFDDATGNAWLDIKANGGLLLNCQRCLQPFEYNLKVANRLRLLHNEEQLKSMEALEAEGEGVDYEYIVAKPNTDLMQLLEDELILALPFAPKHEVCPSLPDGKLEIDNADASPFAVLEQLKKH